jgi:uncharacterized protein (TIGR00369 family)
MNDITLDAPRGRSGLDVIRGFITGELPPPGAVELLGIRMADAEHGRVVMTLVPDRRHDNPMGTMHGGVLATLLDSVMTCAVLTTLPAGRGCTTLEIKVNYLRAVTAASGELSAEGKIVQSGRRTAVAEGRVTDTAGKLCATASTTCLVFDVAEAAA